jgi:anaerobic magnesium-protoporphyrin IX monomethyl ester cyclase
MWWHCHFSRPPPIPRSRHGPAAQGQERRQVPIIVGGPFATLNADRILGTARTSTAWGWGKARNCCRTTWITSKIPAPWRASSGVATADRGEHARVRSSGLGPVPYPDRTSLPIDYIESLPLDLPAVLSLDKFCTVQTSRGCPYACIYCDIPSLGEGRWRKPFAGACAGRVAGTQRSGLPLDLPDR